MDVAPLPNADLRHFAVSATTTTNREKMEEDFFYLKGKNRCTSAAPPGRPSSFPGKRLIRLLTALASVRVCVCVCLREREKCGDGARRVR